MDTVLEHGPDSLEDDRRTQRRPPSLHFQHLSQHLRSLMLGGQLPSSRWSGNDESVLAFAAAPDDESGGGEAGAGGEGGDRNFDLRHDPS
jgi:hypothetical protein